MALDLGNIDWGGLLTAGLNLFGSKQNAGSNQSAANTYAQQTKFNPYNVIAGNSGVLFNGNSALGSLSQPYQNIQGQLTGGASGLLGNIGDLYGNGGINPFLQGGFDQYNADAPGSSSVNPINSNLGSQFGDASQGFLGSLGSLNPNQLSGDYTNLLRSQAAPGNSRAAEGLAQNLFNTGRLGSTGGQGMFGELINQQNQQDLGFQLAGRQYSGQEQSRVAGLGQQFGQASDAFSNSLFGRNLQSNQNSFNQTNARAQQRFQNAMQLFGAGQQNAQNQTNAGLGLLQGSQGLDQDLLRAIQTGGYLGGASSSANQGAYNPSMQANVAGNNASSAGWLGLAQALGLPDMLGGAMGKLLSGGQTQDGGGDTANFHPSQDLTNWLGSPPDQVTGQNFNANDPTTKQWAFSGAGGQATTGNGLLNSMFGGNYDFLGGQSQIPNGLQNLDYTGALNSYADSIQGKNLAGNGNIDVGKYVNNLGSALGMYQGINQGGTKGYGQAVAAGSNIASNLGLIGGQAGNVGGLLGNAASGNYINAAKNAAGLLSGSGVSGAANTAAAAGDAASGVGSGSAAGLGGALTAAVPAFLATQLVTGLTQGNSDLRAQQLPGASSHASGALGAFLFSPDGPGKSQDGGYNYNGKYYPQTLTLKDGTVLNEDQYNQLKNVYMQNIAESVKHPGKAGKEDLNAKILDLIKQFSKKG